ncbi:hypothetical protein KVP10_15765 [Candidimonas humi]|uniref:Uncharacterized protein n=1 Tax=Candidimonas humi TaxID=683355 RepID=A0ABV8P0L7_9BURK|nr:hypothetical protein [Candidimonas humi]MBV6306349.1 hypothetical protein [Candidimonas humi]
MKYSLFPIVIRAPKFTYLPVGKQDDIHSTENFKRFRNAATPQKTGGTIA